MSRSARRTFDARDTLASPRVAIIDDEFARKYFPQGAVGQRFAYGNKQSLPAIMPSMREVMRAVEPELPIYGEATLDSLFASNISTPRLTSMLLAVFAALGLVLSAFGLSGVLSYLVGQRTREIGVRLAIGALPREVVTLMTRQGMKLAGLGLGIGLIAALGLAQLLARVLYQVSPFDLQSFVSISVVLLLVGFIACWLPARRATKVDPMIALRCE